jgi:hypothetical protein
VSREVWRVPLDFDWPLGKVWGGYVMPEELELPTCSDCGGAGSTPAARWVLATAHMLLMLDDDLAAQARGREMHPYFHSYYTTAYGTRPSPDIREFGTGLAGREASFLGHDSIDGWRAARKIIAAAGLDPDVWGICPTCSGTGNTATPEQRAKADAWRTTPPPTGDGWQLWETVSEGSPVTPVFATAEELIDHLATVGQRSSGPMRRSAAEVLVRSGSSLGSLVGIGGQLLDSAEDADRIADALGGAS